MVKSKIKNSLGLVTDLSRFFENVANKVFFTFVDLTGYVQKSRAGVSEIVFELISNKNGFLGTSYSKINRNNSKSYKLF